MSEVFDRAHFAHMTGDDAALQREVIALFFAQVAEWKSALAPRAPDGEWRDAVHKLKGSARGIGLCSLADACEAAEAAPEGEIEAALTLLFAALAQALEAMGDG